MTATAQKARVVRLPVRRPASDRTVLELIQVFIENKGKKSKNTATAYLADIKQFFMFMGGKSLDELTDDDLIYSHTDIADYQNHLADKYGKGSTVNRKIASVKSLMEFLARDNKDIRMEVYDLDKMDENTESYGNLSVEEWMQMCELVKCQEKGEEKSVLIELAGRTSIRLNALLTLNISQVRRIGDVYAVDVIDKGNKEDTKAIPDALFERMKALGATRGNGDVFGLARNTINAMMRTLCEQMEIPDSRNIVFHSLKKVAINDILRTSGNLMEAQKQGNHGSANTTLKHYAEIEKEKNLQASPGLHLGKEIDLSVLDDMSAEQLLVVIRSLSRSAQSEILHVAKNISR